MVHSSHFGRVVVAIDASAPNVSALEIAARFADAMSSELVGLFVENVDLLNLASLPFSREVTVQTVTHRKLSPSEIERGYRGAAAIAKKALARLASERDLRWRFDVVRGHMTPEIVSAAKSCDLLVLSEQLRSLEERRTEIGVRIVYEDVPCNATLVVGPRSGHRSGPVVAVVQSDSLAEHVVEMAASIAGNLNLPIHILSISKGENEPQSIQQICDDLELPQSNVILESIDGFSAFEIGAIVNSVDANVVIMSADLDERITRSRVTAMEKVISTPILVMRS